MSEHTPGPWRAVAREKDGRVYPHIDVNSDTLRVAENLFARDAALIAAAPELLELAEAVALGNSEYDRLSEIARALLDRIEGGE